MNINLYQKTRPYKIDIFGLQDNFIGCLQSYNDSFLGQIIEPRMEIKEDGTQTFTCKIPKFYLSEVPNKYIINPRWEDIENGVIAENTRILKISIQFGENNIKTFPFIIDKISNKREQAFSAYKEIIGNGLAFAELGKQGYKIELNSTILEQDFSENSNTLATINYWLDKVFPNEKNEEGKIVNWLTPWSYEIRMNWSGYFEQLSNTIITGGKSDQLEVNSCYDSEDSNYIDIDEKWIKINAGMSGPSYDERDSTKLYENPYISDWDIQNGKLTPISSVIFEEKARYIDCYNSNKYNITQSIAEAFEVFCVYEYACDQNGYFKKIYYDENNNLWTGKKVIFYNKAIKTEKPYVINYQNNLQSITRTIDSSEVYTKMYVNPIASEVMSDGYVTIANTSLNPLLDDFILNFDYLYEIGSINDLQKNEIEKYKIQLHKINKDLIKLTEEENDLVTKINTYEAQKTAAKAAMESSQEQLILYEKHASQMADEPVIKNQSNPYSMVLVPKTSLGILQGTFRLEGVNISSIYGYIDKEYTKLLFNPNELVPVQNAPADAAFENGKNRWYITKDEYGYPATIFTSIQNENLKNFFGENFNPDTGALLYFGLEYFPKNKYETICLSFQKKIEISHSQLSEYENLIGSDEGENNNWYGLKKELRLIKEQIKKLQEKKQQLNFRFERILGPALREGYWQPEKYEDPGEGHNENVKYGYIEENAKAKFVFDAQLFEEEQKQYYYASNDDVAEENKTYYPYIDLSSIYKEIAKDNHKVSDFCITLAKPNYIYKTSFENSIIGKGKYYFLLDGQYYYFTAPDINYPANTIITIDMSEALKIVIDNGLEKYECAVIAIEKVDFDGYNITGAFMGSGQYLSERHLYNNSGFVYSFLKIGQEIKLVALLQQEDIDYKRYNLIKISYNKNQEILSPTNLIIENGNENNILFYPRIYIDSYNVNNKSDNLKITLPSYNKTLTAYEDYSIMTRKGKTYITLKITDNVLPKYILNDTFNIIYQISRANEKLYLDSKQVAKDNSKPKYSYEIEKANIPNDIQFLELGQLCYINDYSIDAYKERGYISGLNYNLDQPSKDSITVSNYKTKFEDLFSSISAQSEAMKKNEASYNIAAAAFTGGGAISETILQNTLNNNSFSFKFDESNLILDDKGGLVLTNKTPFSNGVNGQVALRGGGIWCSGSINDQTGERNWETAITPEGINATAIKTGELDTSLIRILSGNKSAFQWNGEGLFAFKEIQIDGAPDYDKSSYIKFSEEGLQYVLSGSTQLNLGWNGFEISNDDGHLKLNSRNGLQLFGENENPIVTFGKYNNQFGAFFLDNKGSPTLTATSDGKLSLVGELILGDLENENYAILKGNPEADYNSEAGAGDYYFMVSRKIEDSDYGEMPAFGITGEGYVYCSWLTTPGVTQTGGFSEISASSYNATALSLYHDSDPNASTIQATAIMADEMLYSPELWADESFIDDITVGENLIISNTAKITFINGQKKATIFFDGEEIKIKYE